MKTSSRDLPRVYATGDTLKPSRRGWLPWAGSITKPDCFRRVSTLHSAHLPVRGHAGLELLLGVLLTAGDTFATELGPVEESDPVDSLLEPLHPHPKTVRAPKATQKFLIDCKDRRATQAPRLLFLRSSQEGSWRQQS